MERDPLAFVRRRTLGAHAAAVVLCLCAIPLLWLGFELVRILFEDGLRGGNGAAEVSFLALTLRLPERILEEPLVLFRGVPVARSDVALWAAGSLAAVAAFLALILVTLGALRASIGARAVATLRAAVLDAVAGARPAQKEEARHAGALVGESLARESGFLGGAVVVPLAAGSAIAAALLYDLRADWRLALPTLAGLVLALVVWPRRLAAARRASETRLQEGAAYRRSLGDLVRRLPAVAAHGSAEAERERLTRELGERRVAVSRAERSLGMMEAASGLVIAVAPLAVLGLGAWIARDGALGPGRIAAAVTAALVAMRSAEALAAWQAARIEATAVFEEIARALAALQARDRRRTDSLPPAGAFAARDLSGYDAATGARLSAANLVLPMPSHVALVGDAGSGAQVLAGLLGGRLDPTSGRLTFGDVDLPGLDPSSRAQRIGYSGGPTVLIPGTLRQNLLYGVRDPGADDMEGRLFETVTVVGLDGFVHSRGLAGAVDPLREPKLAAAVVDSRRAVHEALSAAGLEGLIDPFDPARYNSHATIGENILFGVPVGDTFHESNLAGHPFLRAVLEAEELTRPLTAMGVEIARGALEIFSDLPEGHPIFERFSFFPSSQRARFEDLVERGGERRRGPAADADREALVGLALRYDESRHRLGLMDRALEERIVAARRAFAQLLPTSLAPAIAFHDPGGLNPAASLQDNLLFGRIAHDRAGASAQVRAVVRGVLSDRGLDAEVMRIGLETRIDPRGDGLTAADIAAIDLARCLVRRPDVLVVENVLAGLTTAGARELLGRLRRALVGRGLVIALGDRAEGLAEASFDRVVRFERADMVQDDEAKVEIEGAAAHIPSSEKGSR